MTTDRIPWFGGTLEVDLPCEVAKGTGATRAGVVSRLVFVEEGPANLTAGAAVTVHGDPGSFAYGPQDAITVAVEDAAMGARIARVLRGLVVGPRGALRAAIAEVDASALPAKKRKAMGL